MPTVSPDDIAQEAKKGANAVTWRSALLCLLLVPVSVYWQLSMETVRNSTHPSALSLPFHVVFILLTLTGANRLWARFVSPRTALTIGELLLTYSVLAISSAVAGVDTLQVMIPAITYGFRNAGANGWESFTPLLPAHLTISDAAVFERYYIGYGSVWVPAIRAAWLPVVLRWTGFVTLLLWVMLCVNAVLRRAWTENEKLTFPVVQLPLQIVEPTTWSRAGLFGGGVFWTGFLVAAVPDMFNSLNFLFPGVPPMGYTGNGYSYVDMRYLPGLDQFLTRPPLSAMGETPVSFYPFVIGLGVLMPLDFLASVPLFYWGWKLQRVLTVALALDLNPRFPFTESQSLGAYLSFFILSLTVARGHLRRVWQKACGKRDAIDDTGEPMPYALAVWGGLAGVAALVWFAATMGLTWWIGVLFFAIYFALAIAITRMRAELGTPVHDLHHSGPDMVLTRLAGSRTFDDTNLVALGLLGAFNQAYRSHPMPHQLESYKLADHSGAARRPWTVALLVGGAFVAFVTFWIFLHLMYKNGAAAKIGYAYGYSTFAQIASWTANPLKSDPAEWVATAWGFALAAGMQWARLRFAWFTLHPLAYAVTSSYQMNIVWLPLTLAWLAKATLLRFGGLNTFRRALPFFFGLMLGQFVTGSLWNILGTWLDLPTYRFWD